MSLEFLIRIARGRFPLVIRQRSEIDKVRLLKAAELITASIPSTPLNSQADDAIEAVVFGVTERGALVAREEKAPPEPPFRGASRLRRRV